MSRSYLSSPAALTLALLLIASLCEAGHAQSNSSRALTPLQLEIQKQQNRLSSAEVEDRRDALIRLGALNHPEASRAATAGLKDALAIVRVTATSAVLSLPKDEAAAALLPLLNDKDEFVRQETAYALGKARSRTAVSGLLDLLAREKKSGARGAIVVALGDIGDEAAVVMLVQLLRPQLSATGSKKQKSKKENPLILRAAARSLGQIGNRAAVPALLAIVQDEQAESDVRREAAIALGLIGDASALPTLNGLVSAPDPYLSLAAFEASRRIRHQNAR